MAASIKPKSILMRHVCAICTVVFSLFVLQPALAAPTLYIFSPSYIKAHVTQKKIETLCPNVDISVFAKAKDFNKQTQIAPPDAAISLATVISQYGNYSLLFKGKRANKHQERYFLVSVDLPTHVTDLSGKKVGVLDLLGRKPMTEFIKRLLGDISVKRVSKTEDLLPLLSFKAVDALFISESDMQDLKQATQLNLKISPTKIKLGRSVAAYANPANKNAISQCVSTFDKSVNEYFGVEKWSSPL